MVAFTHLAMIQNPKPNRTPSEHPNSTTRIGSKMGGAPTNQNGTIGFDPQPIFLHGLEVSFGSKATKSWPWGFCLVSLSQETSLFVLPVVPLLRLLSFATGSTKTARKPFPGTPVQMVSKIREPSWRPPNKKGGLQKMAPSS